MPSTLPHTHQERNAVKEPNERIRSDECEALNPPLPSCPSAKGTQRGDPQPDGSSMFDLSPADAFDLYAVAHLEAREDAASFCFLPDLLASND